MDSYGISFYIVGAEVIDFMTDLHIHIALGFFEFIGEIGRTLIGQVYAAYLVGDIHVEDGVFVKQAVLCDEIVYRGEIL